MSEVPFKLINSPNTPVTAWHSNQSLTENNRHPGLDFLRIFGLMGVVILHACMAYLVVPLPGLAWPMHDSVTSSNITFLFWGMQGFIMPLFFVLSGFASCAMLFKHGEKTFTQLRQKRILYPLLFGVVVLLPLEVYIWTLGWIANERYPWNKLFSLKFTTADAQSFWGLSHLWYLQYLAMYAGIHSGLLYAKDKYPIVVKQVTHIQSKINLLIAALIFWGIASTLLYISPRITLGFKHDFLPFATNFVYYSLWYLVGVAIYRHKFLDKCNLQLGSFALMGGFLILAILYPIVQTILSPLQPDYWKRGELTWLYLVAAVLIPVYAFLMITGLMQVFSQLVRRRNHVLRYLAGASLFVYLCHHPICAVCHLYLQNTPVAAEIKLLIVVFTSISLSLGLYEFGVRKTVVGRFLHGYSHAVPNNPAGEELHQHPDKKAA